jgi:drug/metabolite transporter (DMT)-like permease
VSGALGFWLVGGVLVAVVAYREAVNFAKQNGRTPWDMPPWAWALVAGVLGLLLGAILLVIARRTTKPLRAAPPWSAPTPVPPNDAWSSVSSAPYSYHSDGH